MLEMILPFVIAFLSLASFNLGYMVRNRIHVLIPIRDPITLTLFAIALYPIWATLTGLYTPVEPLNVWYLAALITFTTCYSMSYIRAGVDVFYCDVHTIVSEQFPAGAQQVFPIVWGEDKYGQLYRQEQSFKEIMKAVIFGIHSGLRFPMGQIQRTRVLEVERFPYPKMQIDCVDVVEEVITEEIVTKWKFLKFKVRNYSYTPAPACIDNTQRWLVSSETTARLIKDNTRKDAALLESKINEKTTFYAKGGDLLVELINDRTPGADVYEDLKKRLAPADDEYEVPRRVRVNRASKSKKKVKKSVFRKAPKEEPETEEVADDAE